MNRFKWAFICGVLSITGACTVAGGPKHAAPPDPERLAPDSRHQGDYWYISHHYGPDLAREYLNQPQTGWHRGETFERQFLKTLLTLDPSGQSCIAFWNTGAIPNGGISIDCLWLTKDRRLPSWTASRETEGARILIMEYPGWSPRVIRYYYSIDYTVFAVEVYELTSRSSDWQRTGERKITDLLASDAELRQSEIQRYRQAVLTHPLPRKLLEALSKK